MMKLLQINVVAEKVEQSIKDVMSVKDLKEVYYLIGEETKEKTMEVANGVLIYLAKSKKYSKRFIKQVVSVLSMSISLYSDKGLEVRKVN